MDWQIDLIGHPIDIAEVAKFASSWNVTITEGPEGEPYLTGTRFGSFETAQEVRVDAEIVLRHLNGRVRIEHGTHQVVRLGGGISKTFPDGRNDVAVFLEGTEIRIRSAPPIITVTRPDGTTEFSSEITLARESLIASNNDLVEILDALADEITWQRLRVSFEKITVLIGGTRKNSQAIWQNGYASREDVERFKANAEDPRHTGLAAVHGVPSGPLKGTKMSLEDGRAFFSHLFNAYLDSRFK